MTRTANEIFAELYYLEREMADPVRSKGKLTTLKAIYRKRITEYRKAIK